MQKIVLVTYYYNAQLLLSFSQNIIMRTCNLIVIRAVQQVTVVEPITSITIE